MKTTKMLAILVLLLASVANGSRYLTVNNQPVASITLEAGQTCTVEVVSDNSESYVAYAGFDNGLVLGDFSHLETRPEAGDLNDVTEYSVPAFYGYCVVAAGMAPPPSPGVHFVFQYEAQQFGETDVKLYNETFTNEINSIHITVIPASMGTAFTYQGRLMDANVPADGLYDLQFKLYNHPNAGNQQGGTIDVNDLDVIDGHFTVELDFCILSAVEECGIFHGDALWLEIGVRQAQSPFEPGYTILSPRQELTPTPYALYAQRASPGHLLDAADGSPTDAVYVDNDGKVGIGTKTPGQQLDVVGNARITQDIYEGLLKLSDKYLGKTATAVNSDKVDGYHAGNASGQVAVSNGTVCVNLNADRLDGYHAGNASGQVAVSNGTVCVNLNADKADKLDGYHAGNASGQVAVSNSAVCTELNADKVDGYHAGNASGQVAVSNSTVCTNLNADNLDGYHAGSFVMPDDDYGRSGVSSTLYEGTTTLTDKYVNKSGDTMAGSTPYLDEVLTITNGGNGPGIRCENTGSGNLGHLGSSTYGVLGHSTGGSDSGVHGKAMGWGGRGVWGWSTGEAGRGVKGQAQGGPDCVGVDGFATGDRSIGIRGEGDWYAGYFVGNVRVTGSLSKGSGSFEIDHPLDPENKYLSHSFVESPDMMNIYNGNVTLDDKGRACVKLPDYFDALNRDFRYQLTCIGAFAPVYIAEKISDNRFKIAGGKPGMQVSWQVTGVRQDAYAVANRIVVEKDKPTAERGYYLHPKAYGLPEEKNIRVVQSGHVPENRQVAKNESR